MNEAAPVTMLELLDISAIVQTREQLGRATDEAAGLVPLHGPPPAERAVPPLPWSTYAAMLRGL